MAKNQSTDPNPKPDGAAETVLLDHVLFRTALAELCKKQRMREGSQHEHEVAGLLEEARAIARPKARCRIAFVEHEGDDEVAIGSARFTSRVLRVNLDGVCRVFPYLATCGTELAQWYSAQGDLPRQFWAETIAEPAPRCDRGRAPARAPSPAARTPHGQEPQLATRLAHRTTAPAFQPATRHGGDAGPTPDRERVDDAHQVRAGHLVPDGDKFRGLPVVPSGALRRAPGAVRWHVVRGEVWAKSRDGLNASEKRRDQ